MKTSRLGKFPFAENIKNQALEESPSNIYDKEGLYVLSYLFCLVSHMNFNNIDIMDAQYCYIKLLNVLHDFYFENIKKQKTNIRRNNGLRVS